MSETVAKEPLEVFHMERACVKCGAPVFRKRGYINRPQAYCAACHALYMREWRVKRKAKLIALAELAESLKPH